MPSNPRPIEATYRTVCNEREAITGTVPLWDACQFLRGDSWRNTPIHEAGHAVMAKHFRVPLYGVSLYGSDSPESRVAEGAVHFRAPRPDWHRSYGERVARITESPLPGTNEIGVALVLIYQAGLLAELLAANKPPGPDELVFAMGSPDHRLAVHYAGTPETIRTLLACQRVALGILERQWHALLSVASILEARKFIAGSEITSVIHPPTTIN